MSLVSFFRPEPSRPGQERTESLDGLRGVAVLLVLLSHLSNAGFDLHAGLRFRGAGKPGVFLFFVLSGFLLTRQFLQGDRERVFSRAVWLDYARKRALRILPLFAVALLTSALVSQYVYADFEIPLTWSEVGAHLRLQQGKSIFWTIPVEVKYYACLPLVVLVMRGLFRSRLLLCSVVLLGVLVFLELASPAAESDLNGIRLAPYLPIFLTGSLSALLYGKLEAARFARSRGFRAGSEGAAILLFAGVLLTIPDIYNRIFDVPVLGTHFHRDYGLYAGLWSLFLVTQLLGTGRIRSILSAAPLRFLGNISFSVYLWHYPIIPWVKHDLPVADVAQFPLIAILVLSISTLTYHGIEKPFIRWGRNWDPKER